MKNRIGIKIKCTGASDRAYWAYVPKKLPPADIRLEEFQEELERASQALGRLDGIATILPDTHIFLYMYVRKEAVLSSQIEGTQSSLSDLLLFESNEATDSSIDDVQEVSNYVAAMNHGLKMLKKVPLSLRLIKEIHRVVTTGSRGSNKAPGSFRRSQNWIGGTKPQNAVFVPPPPDKVTSCMNDLEKFIHSDKYRFPLLVKAAMIHHQFETIHPFLDGNGRVGRLLITLLMCSENALSQPVLYLSLFFKKHREEYYRQLQAVRTEGNWESWLKFFLEGVEETANEASETANKILKLTNNDREIISGLGRGSGSALKVHRFLEKKPLATIPELVKKLKLTTPTVTTAIGNLESAGIVKEITGRQRNKVYSYNKYFRIITADT